MNRVLHELRHLSRQTSAIASATTYNSRLSCCPLAQVEIKTSKDTPDIGNLQRAADFIHAFLLGVCGCQAPLHCGILSASFAIVVSYDGDSAGCHTLHDNDGGACAGFEVADAIALLRLDDLYVECFEVKDVKARVETSAITLPHHHAGSMRLALTSCWELRRLLSLQTLRGEHLSRCIGRLAGKVRVLLMSACFIAEFDKLTRSNTQHLPLAEREDEVHD